MHRRRRGSGPVGWAASQGIRAGAAGAMALLLFVAVGCGPEDVDGDAGILLRPNGDLLAAGQSIQLTESIEGDAMLVGGTVEYQGDVGGSYLSAGGDQWVGGRIEGSGRVVGGNVRFGASVGRNVTLAGGQVELTEDAVIERNAYLAGGLVQVDGTILGDLYVGAGEAVLDGTIDGDVRVEADRLRIGPSARIQGDLRYRVGSEPASIHREANIGGDVEVLPLRGDIGPSAITMNVLRVLAFLLCAGVVIALFPAKVTRMVDAVRARPGAALGLGLLWAVCVPVVTLVIAVTVVGIPLALILAAVYAASAYLAPAVPAMWLGDLLTSTRAETQRRSRLKAFLVGGPLVGIAILLPWAGLIVRLSAGLLGLGGMVLAVGRTRP